jgi:hypothetical protein
MAASVSVHRNSARKPQPRTIVPFPVLWLTLGGMLRYAFDHPIAYHLSSISSWTLAFAAWLPRLSQRRTTQLLQPASYLFVISLTVELGDEDEAIAKTRPKRCTTLNESSHRERSVRWAEVAGRTIISIHAHFWSAWSVRHVPPLLRLRPIQCYIPRICWPRIPDAREPKTGGGGFR